MSGSCLALKRSKVSIAAAFPGGLGVWEGGGTGLQCLQKAVGVSDECCSNTANCGWQPRSCRLFCLFWSRLCHWRLLAPPPLLLLFHTLGKNVIIKMSCLETLKLSWSLCFWRWDVSFYNFLFIPFYYYFFNVDIGMYFVGFKLL